MIKSILSGFFFILLCSAVFGQSGKSFTPELSLGINGGATYSKINFMTTTQKSVPQRMLLQSTGGISGRYISEKHFGLQLELNYSQRGWEEYHSDNLEFSYIRSLSYLEVPLLTHLYFNAGKKVRVIFNIGPQLSYLFKERTPTSTFIPFPEQIGDGNPNYYMPVENKFDWGICGGGGLEFQSGVGNFVLEGRYYYGLSNIYNNSHTDYFATSSNQIVNLKLTYFYQIGRGTKK